MKKERYLWFDVIYKGKIVDSWHIRMDNGRPVLETRQNLQVATFLDDFEKHPGRIEGKLVIADYEELEEILKQQGISPAGQDKPSPSPAVQELTVRQREVLELKRLGKTDDEVAGIVKLLTRSGVKKMLDRLRKKHGFATTDQLIQYYYPVES